MKRIIFTGMVLLTGVTGEAMAACGLGSVQVTDISIPTLSGLLTGNTVCVGSAGNWQAQEFHQSGGNLIDWKKGASDPVDPTSSVGSWSITGTLLGTRVNYTYGSTTYNDKVYDNLNGTYSFCDQNTNETIGTVITGQNPC